MNKTIVALQKDMENGVKEKHLAPVSIPFNQYAFMFIDS